RPPLEHVAARQLGRDVLRVGRAAAIAAQQHAMAGEDRVAQQLARLGDRAGVLGQQPAANADAVDERVPDDLAHDRTSLSTGRLARSSRASRITASSGTVHAAALPTSPLGLPTAMSLPLNTENSGIEYRSGATERAREPSGANSVGESAKNSPMIGASTRHARCIGPESFDTTSFASANSTSSSRSEMSPAITWRRGVVHSSPTLRT